MSLSLPPTQAFTHLSYLVQFVLLRQEFRKRPSQGCDALLKTRIRLKKLETRIPPNLLKYANMLLEYPRLIEEQVIDQHCPICGSVRHVEWLPVFGEKPLMTTCSECDAVLFLNPGGFLHASEKGHMPGLPKFVHSL